MEIITQSRAYPTIGIVLLGGISDDQRRYPLHPSAGISYTSTDGRIYTETSIVTDRERVALFNGREIDRTYRSPIKVLEKYDNRIRESLHSLNGELGFMSENRDIPSGSSDSGAAALGRCIMNLCKDIDQAELENDLRVVSESVGRSLVGGLTVTLVENGIPKTKRLLGPSAFAGYRIIACRFRHERRPSDDIHKNIVKSPLYSERITRTEERVRELEKLAGNSDIEGIFDMAQMDTEDYHYILESTGIRIITDEMRRLIQRLKLLSRDRWNRYIVTGGNNVFVAVREGEESAIIREAMESLSIPVVLRVAGEAFSTDIRDLSG